MNRWVLLINRIGSKVVLEWTVILMSPVYSILMSLGLTREKQIAMILFATCLEIDTPSINTSFRLKSLTWPWTLQIIWVKRKAVVVEDFIEMKIRMTQSPMAFLSHLLWWYRKPSSDISLSLSLKLKLGYPKQQNGTKHSICCAAFRVYSNNQSHCFDYFIVHSKIQETSYWYAYMGFFSNYFKF